MPTKQQPDTTYGEKLISLFARLLFSGEWVSLSQLARELGCSKQTVLRLIRDIESGYDVPLETDLQGQRRVYRVPRRIPHRPAAMLTHEELESLLMCRAFTEHLLGRDRFDLATRALEKTTQLVTDHELAAVSSSDFGVFRPGSIDYRPFHDRLRTLTEAMQEHFVCKVCYRKPGTPAPETLHIKPLKIFAWRETIYVHAREAHVPAAATRRRDYDPLLALQRLEAVTKTTILFRKPRSYDFEKVFNRHFGMIRGKPFKVVADFTGWAADYVAERQWSPKQTIARQPDGRLRLEFDAVSMPEVVTWVIGFGRACEVRSPRTLVEAIQARVTEVRDSLHSVSHHCRGALMNSTGCPFCNPQPPFIAENDTMIAIPDGFPVTLGHSLIISRRHVPSYFDLSASERGDLWSLLEAVRTSLVERFNPDGYNIGFNDGPVAGQTIKHMHLHVIPRRVGDVDDPRGGIRWVFPAQAKYWDEDQT